MQIMNLLKIHAFHRYNFETFYCQVEQYLHCYPKIQEDGEESATGDS